MVESMPAQVSGQDVYSLVWIVKNHGDRTRHGGVEAARECREALC